MSTSAKTVHSYASSSFLTSSFSINLLVWGTKDVDKEFLKKISVGIVWESYKGVAEDPSLWKRASKAVYLKLKDKTGWSSLPTSMNHHTIFGVTLYSLLPRTIPRDSLGTKELARLFNFRTPSGGILTIDYKVKVVHSIWSILEYSDMMMLGYGCLEKTEYYTREGGVIDRAVISLDGMSALDPYLMVEKIGIAPLIEDPNKKGEGSSSKMKFPALTFKK